MSYKINTHVVGGSLSSHVTGVGRPPPTMGPADGHRHNARRRTILPYRTVGVSCYIVNGPVVYYTRSRTHAAYARTKVLQRPGIYWLRGGRYVRRYTPRTSSRLYLYGPVCTPYYMRACVCV